MRIITHFILCEMQKINNKCVYCSYFCRSTTNWSSPRIICAAKLRYSRSPRIESNRKNIIVIFLIELWCTYRSLRYQSDCQSPRSGSWAHQSCWTVTLVELSHLTLVEKRIWSDNVLNWLIVRALALITLTLLRPQSIMWSFSSE